MRQATIVMLYGPKPPHLAKLIIACQEKVASMFGHDFFPYEINQTHATLLSLERIPRQSMVNKYFFMYRNQAVTMDIVGLINFLQESNYFPLQIQIGGFHKGNSPFTSQDKEPYERSFSIKRAEVLIPVLIGWPIREAHLGPQTSIIDRKHYPTILDQIRRKAQTFNVLHRYHRTSSDRDNDFYMRIGLLSQSSPEDKVRKTEHMLWKYLCTMEPSIIDIKSTDLSIVSYQDETLPLTSSRVWHLHNMQITPDFVLKLYQ